MGVVFNTGKHIYIRVTEEKGSLLITHCAEGIVPYSAAMGQEGITIKNCIPADGKDSKLFEGELFAMLGVEGWSAIDNYAAAAAFTEYLVGLEETLEKGDVELERLINFYELAATARGLIKTKGSLSPSKRWNIVQEKMFKRLQEMCHEDEGKDEASVRAKKALVWRFAEIAKANGGPSVISLQLELATNEEKTELCGETKVCLDLYERLSEEGRKAKNRRISLVHDIVLPEKKRRPPYTLAGELGTGLAMINWGKDFSPLPLIDAGITYRPIKEIGISSYLRAYFAPAMDMDEYVTQPTIFKRSYDQGVVMSAGAKICLYIFEFGGGFKHSEKLHVNYYKAPDGPTVVQSVKSEDVTEGYFEAGYAVNPLDWLGFGTSVTTAGEFFFRVFIPKGY